VAVAVVLAAATRTTLALAFSSQGPPTKERVVTETESEVETKSGPDPAIEAQAASQAPPRTLQDEMSTASRLWTRAYVLAGAGRSSAGSAIGLAWTKTLWVLAAVVGLQASTSSAKQSASRANNLEQTEQLESQSSTDSDSVRFGATDAGKIKEALQRFDLPFFATSVQEEFKPIYALRVKGNFRGGGSEDVSSSLDRLQTVLETTLGMDLSLHCVRCIDDDTQLDILVRKDRKEDLALDIAVSCVSFVVALGVSNVMTNSAAFQQLGAVVAEGVSLPILSILLLLACGEAARLLVSNLMGTGWRPPVFLPSPLLGFAGSFHYETANATWTERLAVSLASPVAIAMASGGLLALSMSGVGEQVALNPTSALSSLLIQLPMQCDSLLLAGIQGLTMASYSLLPHSPYGSVAWEALCGKRISQRLQEISSYFYPIMGIVASVIAGPGWASLPMFWSFLMINFASKTAVPVREEVSEVPIALKLLGFTALALAAIAAVPVPPQALGLETARTALAWA